MEEWITPNEAEELTGYNREWIRQIAREGRIESKKFGSAVMINRKSLLNYFKKQEQERKKKSRK